MNRRTLLSLPPLLAAGSKFGPPRPAGAQQPQQGATAVAPLAPRQPPLPLAKPEEVGLSAERLARIRPVLEAEVAEGRLPGAVVMIARRGRLAYSETVGFRDRQANAPMAPDAVFRLYSMTKPLTAVAATILMEEGRIGLADPVAKYLPGFDRLQVSVAQGSGTPDLGASIGLEAGRGRMGSGRCPLTIQRLPACRSRPTPAAGTTSRGSATV